MSAGLRIIASLALALPCAGQEPPVAPEEPSIAEQTDAAIAERAAAAARALERGDLAEACAQQYQQAILCRDARREGPAREAFESLSVLARRLGDLGLEARAELGAANAGAALGELGGARERIEGALASFHELGDQLGVAEAMLGLGALHLRRGQLPEAAGLCSEGLEAARACGDEFIEARLITTLGLVAMQAGDYATARDRLAEGTELARRVSDHASAIGGSVNLAFCRLQCGEPTAALAEAERLLPILRSMRDEELESAVLFTAGRALAQLGQHERAREVLEDDLELTRALGDRSRELWILAELGMLCHDRADFVAAREHQAARAELARELRWTWHEAWGLQGVALAERNLGRGPESDEHRQAAFALAEQLQDLGLRACLHRDQGSFLMEKGELADAAAQYERALELAKRANDPGLQSNACDGLGAVAHARGDLEAARTWFEESLRINRASGDRAAEALSRSNLARALGTLGRTREALELAESAVQLARAESPVYLTQALEVLANTHHDLADFARARAAIEEALALARGQGDREAELDALGQLADVLYHLGAVRDALAVLEGARGLAEMLSNDYEWARLGIPLGLLYRVTGQLDESIETYEQSLAWFEQAGALRDAGAILPGLAVSLRRVDRLDEAESHLLRRLELAAEAEDSDGELTALTQLSGLALHRGDLERAREVGDRAVAAGERLDRETTLIDALYYRALAALARDEVSVARADLTRAEELLDQVGARGLEIGDASGLRSRFAFWRLVAQDIVAARMSGELSDEQRSSVVADGFLASGRWKGRALLEGIVEHRSGGRTAEAIGLRRERRELLALRDDRLKRIAASVGRGATRDEIEALRREARELAERARELAVELERVSPADARLDRPVGVTPEAARTALIDEATVLVDYAEGHERLFAYVLTDAHIKWIDLGERAIIAQEVESFLARITDRATLASAGQVAALGGALAERLLAPVLAVAGEGVERVVIIPSASLAKLPFEALVLGGTSESFETLEFAIDRYEFVYGPGAPVLVELAELGPRSSAGRILVLADPLYPSESAPAPAHARPSILAARGRSLPESNELQRLEKTRTEALALAGLLSSFSAAQDAREDSALARLTAGARSGSVEAELYDLHVGAAASPDQLARDLRSYSVLHFAAHGFLDRERSLRSGLALAFTDADEGWFTVADALELDLDANLVVLSACETARGEISPGEGVQSLARAFLFAGSRAVVASAWQVDDRAAAETMQAFYEQMLRADVPPARALRAAKLALRRSRDVRGVPVEPTDGGPRSAEGHPFYWAPFLYVGWD